MAHSSSGLGHRPLKAEITVSNPVCATRSIHNNMAHSSSGLGHRPLKAEITGSNPVCATRRKRQGDNSLVSLLCQQHFAIVGVSLPWDVAIFSIHNPHGTT